MKIIEKFSLVMVVFSFVIVSSVAFAEFGISPREMYPTLPEGPFGYSPRQLYPTLPKTKEPNTNFEAKEFLRNIGFREFIEDAKMLIITTGKVEAKGITGNVPIFASVSEKQIYILDSCAEGTIYETGTIIIKASLLYVSCAYGRVKGKTYLLIGRDLKHIANKMIGKYQGE